MGTEGGSLISKPYQQLPLQHNFLDAFCKRSQDFSMPTPPVKEEDALFIVRVAFLREDKLIQLTFEKGKLIEQLMTADELKDTGVGDLTDEQKAELNAWLDPDKRVAPGGQPHGPG
jgi:hypothetical protein